MGNVSNFRPKVDSPVKKINLYSERKIRIVFTQSEGRGHKFSVGITPDPLIDFTCFARHPISSWHPQAKHCISVLDPRSMVYSKINDISMIFGISKVLTYIKKHNKNLIPKNISASFSAALLLPGPAKRIEHDSSKTKESELAK